MSIIGGSTVVMDRQTRVSVRGREKVEVEMNEDWEENLRHFCLVGVVFLSREAQQSAHEETNSCSHPPKMFNKLKEP